MTHTQIFFLTITALAAFVSACGGNPESITPPDPVSFPLHVRAEIDGRSELRMQGNDIWWHHFEFEAPGMWGDDQPTFLNGDMWYPSWPTEENAFCNCDTDKEALLETPLKSDGSTVGVTVVSARGTVTVTQQPTAGNNYTAHIEFNDPQPDRAWFEAVIDQ
jgi:hypothetical protein